MSQEESNNEDCPPTTVRLVSSIAAGFIEETDDTNRQISWTDVNTRLLAMQERIDVLEGAGKATAEEGVSLLGSSSNNKEEDGDALGETVYYEPGERHITESKVENMYDEYELPESTYSLLMTEKVLSIPFGVGIVASFLSLFALILALKNELDNGEEGNILGLPAGVPSEVRMAQYLGLIIGVLVSRFRSSINNICSSSMVVTSRKRNIMPFG